MKEDFEITESTFVGSYGRFGYEDVIESFRHAEYIYIISYNIDKEMLSPLKNLDAKTKIFLISNIPGRFQNYFSPQAKSRFQKSLLFYKENLNPKNYKSEVSTWFNFNNHSKVILTDKLAYIGSQNFTNASKNNYEAGFVTNNKNTIEDIRSNFILRLVENSINYYTEDFFLILSEYANRLSVIAEEFKDMINETFYIPWDDYPFKKDMWFLNIRHKDVSKEDIINFKGNLKEKCNLMLEELLNVLSENKINELNKQYHDRVREYINKLSSLIETFEESIEEYCERIINAKYFEISETEIAMDIFQEKYGIEATEDKLDYYMDISQQKASEIIQEEAEIVESIIKEVYQQSQDLINNITIIEKQINTEGKKLVDNS